MLALELGHNRVGDRLAEGLWGEGRRPARPKARAALCSHLRRLLDGNGAQIVTRGRGYELRLRGGRRSTRSASRALTRGRSRRARGIVRCGGAKPLADVADEPFAAAEIRRLEELRGARGRAGHRGRPRGRPPRRGGRSSSSARSKKHPLREHLHAQRMLALYRAGRQAEALEAYRQARGAARRADRRRARPRVAGLHVRRPRAGPGARPRRPVPRRRGTCGPDRAARRSVPRAARRDRLRCCCSAASLVIRDQQPDRIRAAWRVSPRTTVGVIDAGQRRDHGAVRGRPRSGSRRGQAAARSGSPTRSTAPSRGSTRRTRRHDPRRRRPAARRVRRRVAVGCRRRDPSAWRRSTRGRTRSQQRLDGRQRAARAGGRGRRAVGRLGHGRRDQADRSRQRARDPQQSR